MIEEYLQHLANRGIIRSEASEKWYRSDTVAVLKLSNGFLLPFHKPQIKKAFYFGEDDRGAGTPEHLTIENAMRCCDVAKSEEYFMRKNLHEYDALLARIDSGSEFYVCKSYNEETDIVDWHVESPQYVPEHRKKYPLTAEDVAAIKETLLSLREKFEKRLKSWYKRYGAKHIRTGTYWISR